MAIQNNQPELSEDEDAFLNNKKAAPVALSENENTFLNNPAPDNDPIPDNAPGTNLAPQQTQPSSQFTTGEQMLGQGQTQQKTLVESVSGFLKSMGAVQDQMQNVYENMILGGLQTVGVPEKNLLNVDPEARKKKKLEREKKYPIATQVGNIAAGLTLPLPTGKAKALKSAADLTGALQHIVGESVKSALISGGLTNLEAKGAGDSDEEVKDKTKESALFGAAIPASLKTVFTAVPALAKLVINSAKKGVSLIKKNGFKYG